MDRTLILVKPDAFARGLTGEIIARFERKGLQLAALKLMTLDEATAKQHYAEHEGKPFFGELVDFITSGPLVAMVLEGPSAIKAARQVIGATNPLEAAPGSIRGDFAHRGRPEHGPRLGLARVGRARGALFFRDLSRRRPCAAARATRRQRHRASIGCLFASLWATPIASPARPPRHRRPPASPPSTSGRRTPTSAPRPAARVRPIASRRAAILTSVRLTDFDGAPSLHLRAARPTGDPTFRCAPATASRQRPSRSSPRSGRRGSARSSSRAGEQLHGRARAASAEARRAPALDGRLGRHTVIAERAGSTAAGRGAEASPRAPSRARRRSAVDSASRCASPTAPAERRAGRVRDHRSAIRCRRRRAPRAPALVAPTSGASRS